MLDPRMLDHVHLTAKVHESKTRMLDPRMLDHVHLTAWDWPKKAGDRVIARLIVPSNACSPVG